MAVKIYPFYFKLYFLIIIESFLSFFQFILYYFFIERLSKDIEKIHFEIK